MNRIALLAAVLCLAGDAFAQEPEMIEPQEAVDACRVLDDPLRRLDCYDQIPGAEVTGGDDGLALPAESNPAVDQAADPKAAPMTVGLPFHRSRMTRNWELDDATHGGLLRVRRHAPVYLLPGRWSSNSNKTPSTPTRPVPNDDIKLDALEVKFQLSLKTKVADNLFGDNGDLWVGFTQQSNWQAYNSVESSPFRETNYSPEAMFSWRTGMNLFGWRWRLFNIGFVHQSNGRNKPLSRSWNRLYALFGLERDNLELYIRPWRRVEPTGSDDNPDINDYFGNGDVRLLWHHGRHRVGVTTRFSPSDNRGAIQADWHFPLRGDLTAYLQVFHGYGETLIDYNHRQTSIGLGVSLVQ